MRAWYRKKILEFKRPSGTSRGILNTKPTYYLVLDDGEVLGIGECSPLKGLSLDDRPNYEEKLSSVVDDLENRPAADVLQDLREWPSIKFGLETAILDLANKGRRIIFDTPYVEGKTGIPINGLIWMGTKSYLLEQVSSLLDRGFTCLKMKIGAINFEDEYNILKGIRKEYSKEDLILRVDANGAFAPDQALEKLKILSELDLHSIEQPIMAGQAQEMAELCEATPLDIALDEELIISNPSILKEIQPQFIILKPSLVGGFAESERWIAEAESLGIDWWATSALESNIGLNAIAQWTFTKNVMGHQGLGTGSLYTNNIPSPLKIRGEEIFYDPSENWKLDELL